MGIATQAEAVAVPHIAAPVHTAKDPHWLITYLG
jgi:hypothetical protein